MSYTRPTTTTTRTATRIAAATTTSVLATANTASCAGGDCRGHDSNESFCALVRITAPFLWKAMLKQETDPSWSSVSQLLYLAVKDGSYPGRGITDAALFGRVETEVCLHEG